MIGLPPICVNDDLITIDDRGRLNKKLLKEDLNGYVFSSELRTTLMGKKGMLRFEGAGSRPLTTVRGVAVCNWNVKPHEILMPHTWLKSLNIPILKSKDSFTSPYWSFKNAMEGDRALLMRCPSIFETSVMGVTLKGWSTPAIGIHPSMCEYLNLDFDGDEVHVAVIADDKSVKEVDSLIEIRAGFDKFTDTNISTIMLECRVPITTDFMLPSTIPLRYILQGVDFISISKYMKLCRCKIELNDSIRDRLIKRSYVRKYVETSNNTVPYWSREKFSTEQVYINNEGKGREYGYPACRVFTRIASNHMQKALDDAKHTVTSTGEDVMISLMDPTSPSKELRSFKGKLSIVNEGVRSRGKRIGTTSRIQLGLMNNHDCLQNCTLIVIAGCKSMGIDVSDSALTQLVSVIYHAVQSAPNAVLSAELPVRFLSEVNSNYLTVALTENIITAD
ncbi:uncharacterized protein EV154DRAFT_437808, partial [Mucor mucedo]|uniref:uncharacterized protein n=1 Tax=Mucor mucedo TaxID=29922 RepID=UPI00221FBBE3